MRLASHKRLRQFGEDGEGYLQIQGNRPQTLVCGLTDSPAGQLAWTGEHGVDVPGHG